MMCGGRGPYIIIESIRFSVYSQPLCRVVWLPTGITDSWSLSGSRMLYKANSDVCHTSAILDVAHGNIQQPAHNLYKLAVQ